MYLVSITALFRLHWALKCVSFRRTTNSANSLQLNTASSSTTPIDALSRPSKAFNPEIAPEALTVPRQHPQTHGIPVGLLHLRSHSPAALNLFIHFVLHAAYAFGIPASRAAALPTKRSLYTVIRSPFIYKKSVKRTSRNSSTDELSRSGIRIWKCSTSGRNTSRLTLSVVLI